MSQRKHDRVQVHSVQSLEVGLDQRSYSTSDAVSAGTGDLVLDG